MMTEPRDRVDELQDMASDLPNGPAKVALLEEAVHLADSLNDSDLAFSARDELMLAATFAGRPDITLVAFSWCLAQFDRDPQRFDHHSLLWKYKWVMGNSYNFPEISRSRLEALLADMERRFREAGSTLYPVALERRDLLVHFGERKPAQAAHADFRKCRRDFLSDCDACVASGNCYYHCFQRQWGRAVQAAQPVLGGRLTCAEQPHNMLANVLLPLFHLGRLDEAKEYQRQGYRLVSQGSQFVRQHAQHLRFVALIGDLAQAKRLLERHLPGALETVLLIERFEFLLAAQSLERPPCQSGHEEAEGPFAGGTARSRGRRQVGRARPRHVVLARGPAYRSALRYAQRHRRVPAADRRSAETAAPGSGLTGCRGIRAEDDAQAASSRPPLPLIS